VEKPREFNLYKVREGGTGWGEKLVSSPGKESEGRGRRKAAGKEIRLCIQQEKTPPGLTGGFNRSRKKLKNVVSPRKKKLGRDREVEVTGKIILT